ncbi:MAG TPA: hypothetical protein VGE26_01175 [Sphingobacteriaceae bacterium]
MRSLKFGTTWKVYEKVAFRFLFVLFTGFILFFNNGAIPVLMPVSYLFSLVSLELVSWVGQYIFSVPDEIGMSRNGSGDTTYHFLLLFCVLVISIVTTVVWSILDRGRQSYNSMYYWLTALVRFYVGLMLIQYGFAKFWGGQFPAPDVVRLGQSYGDSSPMGLAWTFFGYSDGYKWFMAIAELSGALLLFRRTMTAGAFIALGTTLNIMAVNYFFDVPVKIVSTALVVMCLFLLFIHFRQLFRFFFLGKLVRLPVIPEPFFQKSWQLYTKRAAKALMVIWTLALCGATIVHSKKRYEARNNSSGLFGSHQVVEFNSQSEKATHWKELRLANSSTATLLYRNGASLECMYAADTVRRTLELYIKGPAEDTDVFTYEVGDNGQLELRGSHNGIPVSVTLRKTEPADFTLMKTGFRWVNEGPYNR